MKFISTRLLVSDFPASLRFWRDVMGLSLAYGDEKMGYAYFNTGSTALELMERNGFAAAIGEATPTPTPVRCQIAITFNVDDVDATYAELVERGATSVAGLQDRPEWAGVRTAHLSDPDGYIIEIYSKLEKSDTPAT